MELFGVLESFLMFVFKFLVFIVVIIIINSLFWLLWLLFHVYFPSFYVKHFELPLYEMCYINKIALPCLNV